MATIAAMNASVPFLQRNSCVAQDRRELSGLAHRAPLCGRHIALMPASVPVFDRRTASCAHPFPTGYQPRRRALPARSHRLRVGPQWGRQPFHDVCAARRLAPRQGPTGAPPSTTPLSRRIWPTSTLRKPRQSYSSKTTSTHTLPRRFTRPFLPPRPGGWSSAAPGSTWLNPNSASSPRDASIDASPTNR